MARKTQVVPITEEGRDKGKAFLLREMPSRQAEKWAIRAFLAMARSGLEIPPNIANAGMAGIFLLGAKALEGVKFEEAEPLMDEMFACVSALPSPDKPEIVRALIDDDIEELSTIVRLRKELITLHTGFSFPVAGSTSESAPGTNASTTNT